MGQAPAYISDVLTAVADVPSTATLHSAGNGDYVVPRTYRKLGNRVFSVAAPRAWNRLPAVVAVRPPPLNVLLRRFYSPVHMTNCRSYYRFLLLCVIGLIVGGALNTHVELELELGNTWVLIN